MNDDSDSDNDAFPGELGEAEENEDMTLAFAEYLAERRLALAGELTEGEEEADVGEEAEVDEDEAEVEVDDYVTLEDLNFVTRPTNRGTQARATAMAADGVPQEVVVSMWRLHRRNAECDLDTEAAFSDGTPSNSAKDAADEDMGFYERAPAPGVAPPGLPPSPAWGSQPIHLPINALFIDGSRSADAQVGFTFDDGAYGMTNFGPSGSVDASHPFHLVVRHRWQRSVAEGPPQPLQHLLQVTDSNLATAITGREAPLIYEDADFAWPRGPFLDAGWELDHVRQYVRSRQKSDWEVDSESESEGDHADGNAAAVVQGGEDDSGSASEGGADEA